MCQSDGPAVPAPPRRLPGRRYDRYEARKMILEGFLELAETAEAARLEELYGSWWDREDDPWYPRGNDPLSVYELRGRIASMLEGDPQLVLTDDQFEMVSALADEWYGSLESLVELVTIIYPDVNGLPYRP